MRFASEGIDHELIQAYRECFTTVAGKRVLNHLLRRLGVWHVAADQGDSIMRNVGIEIMENCGILHEDNAELLTEAILAIQPPKKVYEDG